MKRVLVTGASGTIGIKTIKYLLSEGKYDVTALEIKNRKHYKALKRYRKRIDIIYSDVNNKDVMDSLVKETDIIIHLAGVLPSYGNISESMMRNNDYNGTKTIVDSIRKYNPNCFFIYPSSTSVYDDVDEEKTVLSKVKSKSYYSKYKIKSEKYISKYLSNYTIARISYVLGDLRKDNAIYNVKLNTNLEPITSDNVAYGLVAIIDNKLLYNKKVINLTGGEDYRIKYKDYILEVLKSYGLTWKIFNAIIFEDKNYVEGYFKSENFDKRLKFRTKNIGSYIKSLNKYRRDIRRLLPRIFALPFILVIKMKKE